MCDHTNDPGGREAAMAVLERDRNGTATVWCDPCLAPLVTALNAAGLRTIASCCGHGRNDPSVALADGRWITLTTDAPIAYEHRTGASDAQVEAAARAMVERVGAIWPDDLSVEEKANFLDDARARSACCWCRRTGRGGSWH